METETHKRKKGFWLGAKVKIDAFKGGRSGDLSSYEKEVGKKFAKVLPSNWTVKVTAGPYRSYDIAAAYDKKKKEVTVDMYSIATPANPRYVDELVRNAEAAIMQDLDIHREKCPKCRGLGIDRSSGYGRYGIECEPCGGSGSIERYKKKTKMKELR